MYQQQVDDLENNNYSSNNNNMRENNNGEISILSSGHPGIKLWQTISKNIMGINCLYNHAQKRSGFLPISSEVDMAEVGVVRVALVSMGEHISLLDNWYSQPEGASELDPFPDIYVPPQCSQENQA